MVQFNKAGFSRLFGSFLNEFYEDGKLIYQDSALIKTSMLPKQAGSINEFLNDVGDFVFRKAKCSSDPKRVIIEKQNDFFKQYCNFVRLIKVEDRFDNFFETEKYKKLSEEIKDWKAAYGKAMFDLIEGKTERTRDLQKDLVKEGRSSQEVQREINVFLQNYRDPKNQGIMEDADNHVKGKQIEMEEALDEAGIPRPAMMVYNARIQCNDAERHDAKTMLNMLVEDARGSGYFEPMIRSNQATLSIIGSALELSKADKEMNKEDAGKVSVPTSVGTKGAAKYLEQVTLPKNGAVSSETEKHTALVNAQEKCAEKKWKDWKCEVELEKAEKLFYTSKHNAANKQLLAESEERRVKNLNTFRKLDEDEKLDQCKEGNNVKLISEKSLESFKHHSSISGNYMFVGVSATVDSESVKGKSDASCIAFQGVHSLRLQYPWFDKGLFELDFHQKSHGVSLNMEDFRYEDLKDFLLTRCLVPTNVIVGAGMRAYLNKKLLDTFDFDSQVAVEANSLFWSAKAETKNGYSDYSASENSFSVYEPDLLTVLGYELENLCPHLDSNYFQVECAGQQHSEL